MRLALTGTPGTGKTSAALHLAARGIPVVDLNDLAAATGAFVGRDRRRGSRIVDEVLLADAWETVAAVLEGLDDLVVCEGHFAHDLPVDAAAVLRTRPRVLLDRLAARGWPEGKVRENAEAEAMGVVAFEATRIPLAFEVDTTSASPGEVAARVLAGLGGQEPPPDPGRWDLLDLPWLASGSP